jgi:hypothetical protein
MIFLVVGKAEEIRVELKGYMACIDVVGSARNVIDIH